MFDFYFGIKAGRISEKSLKNIIFRFNKYQQP